ncbi:Carboxylic acid reductase [compost metagenome]
MPVTTFRSSMILAHREYHGQLNVPDMFTRLLLSIALTGTAPSSFYNPPQIDDGHPHYDGLPVDFTASAILKLGVFENDGGYRTFNLVNPHDDGISLDTFAKWMKDYGLSINYVDDYTDWHNRLETALRGLPEHLKQQSLLPLIHGFRAPSVVTSGSIIPSPRFQEAVSTSTLVSIPKISKSLIHKYLDDLRIHGLLDVKQKMTSQHIPSSSAVLHV